MSKYTLVDKQDRRVLCEGRSQGIGFAFCRLEGTAAETVMPISPCKDYLNDQVYSELTGNPYSAWGFGAKKRDIIKDGIACLAFSICLKKNGANFIDYPDHKKEVKQLEDNYKNLQAFLNWFEEKLGLKTMSRIEKVWDNMYLAILPDFWCQATYLISLYGLLMRVGVSYTGGDPITHCKNLPGADKYYMPQALTKLERMLKGEIPKQSFEGYVNVHNCGIVEFEFP